MQAEIYSSGRWLPLTPEADAPRVNESDLFKIRGLLAGNVVSVAGTIPLTADEFGCAELRLSRSDDLRGHIGLIPIYAHGTLLGEVEVVPDKMSEEAYRTLRADLEAVWTGLTLDSLGVSSLEAGPPGPDVLWARIERVVQAILAQPHEILEPVDAYRRANLVRRKRELTPAVLRAQHFGGSARVRTIIRTTNTPENLLVADTLRRLRAYAVLRADSATESAIVRCLQHPVLHELARTPSSLTKPYFLDPRYRQVQEVRQLLLRPELAPIEGPGEVRLGVQGLSLLYEYWVFLQVLLQAQEKYGKPLEPGFAVLRIDTPAGPRIEIPSGSTVRFPGGIDVVYEPSIQRNAHTSWNQLEYVPHPDQTHPSWITKAKPDVVVWRRGPRPQALVIDAKYVARAMVEKDASKIHEKYARMLFRGEPVVDHVIAVHPHPGLGRRWAGYSHVAMRPGQPLAALPLPDVTDAEGFTQARPTHPAESSTQGPAATDRRFLVLHQRWSYSALGPRRIDFRRMIEHWGHGAGVTTGVAVMADHAMLGTLAHGLRTAGWQLGLYAADDRAAENQALADAAAAIPKDGQVVLFSGDVGIIAALRAVLGTRLYVVSDVEVMLQGCEFVPRTPPPPSH